ncbi:MAG: hypothetical protein AAFN80_07855 [Pseudomonadota bacterium]
MSTVKTNQTWVSAERKLVPPSVNRIVKLATDSARRQLIFALDSGFAQKESVELVLSLLAKKDALREGIFFDQ